MGDLTPAHANGSMVERTGLGELLPDLTTLAKTANDEGALVDSAVDEAFEKLSSGLLHAIAAGEALTAAKRQVPDGEWMEWVADNIDYSIGTCGTYMRLFEYRDHLTGSSERLTAKTAAKYLVGLPKMQNFGNLKVKLTPEAKAEIARLHGQGLTLHAISELTGFSWATVKKQVDPEYRKQCMDANRRYRQRVRAAKRALEQKERDRAARKAGGSVSSAYSLVRRALAEIDSAITEAGSPEMRSGLQAAMAAMHKAEDAIVASLQVERRS